MSPMDLSCELHTDRPMCAVCDMPVLGVRGSPGRHQVSATTTVYTARVWCMLTPCGHTFTVRPDGLIH
jgi:hypothetical protein